MTEPERVTFYEDAINHAKALAATQLHVHPEIESVSVIFTYKGGLTEIPFAVVQGQTGQLVNPAEIVHTAQQLMRVWNHHMQLGMTCIDNVDTYMKQEGEKLKALQEEIALVTKRLNEMKQEAGGVDEI